MKRAGLWITFLLVMAMVISAWSYHVGFQDGYDAGDHAARSERAAVINACCWDHHHNDIYGCYISN